MELDQYLTTAALLNETLPSAWEIRLFDLTKKDWPLLAQYHTHKKFDAPLRRYLKGILKNPVILENGFLANRNDLASEGFLPKLSLQIIKDAKGNPIGLLVLFLDLSSLMPSYAYFNSLFTLNGTDLQDVEPVETAAVSTELSLDTINETAHAFSSTSPERLTIDEKSELILDLYDTGVFDLKGAVTRAAEVLQMSEQSIYRYIAKVRRLRGD